MPNGNTWSDSAMPNNQVWPGRSMPNSQPWSGRQMQPNQGFSGNGMNRNSEMPGIQVRPDMGNGTNQMYPDMTMPGNQMWPGSNMEPDMEQDMESDMEMPGNQMRPDMGMPGNQMRPDMGMPGNQMRPDMGMPGNQMRPGYMYYPNGSSDRMRGVINPVFRNEEMEKEEQETEHDLERLKGMYPDIAKKIQLFVEEACDDLEYAGSPMFDEQPDKVNMMRTVNSIYDKVREDVPVEEEEDKDDLFAMNKESRRRYPPGKNWLRDFVEVMLYHEMFQRRCRHRHCRRWY